MTEDAGLAQGELKVWRGASVVAWLTFVGQIGVIVVGIGGGAWWLTNLYRDVAETQKQLGERATALETKTEQIRKDRVKDHAEEMAMFCQVMKKFQANYDCSFMLRGDIAAPVERGDAAQPDQPPG
jgi:hypothetical protein